MTGGEISGNTAGMEGGGVYQCGGSFYIGGNAVITGNKKEEEVSNVYLISGKVIYISTETPLTTGASIGVSVDKWEPPTKDNPVAITGVIAADYSSYFSSDNSAYSVKFNTDHLELAVAEKKAISPSVTLKGWAYGASANKPVVTGNTGNGAVTFSYKGKFADDSTYTETVPTDVGMYTVKADIAETDEYESGSCTADFTIKGTEYKVIAGADGTLTQGSISDYTIRADGPYEEFMGVVIDDEVVDEENYTVKSGSTIVTLKASYLETLSVGKHDVALAWEGGSANTTLTIAADVPPTGDSSHMILWLIGLGAAVLASASAVVIMAVRRRRVK